MTSTVIKNLNVIATFENCPEDQLNQEYAGSLIRYLKSETHLEQNIVNMEMKHLSTRSFRNSVYVHTVEVIMLVSCARLWESPASYVRKFLGQPNLWEKSNGTLIKLSRIHQKCHMQQLGQFFLWATQFFPPAKYSTET